MIEDRKKHVTNSLQRYLKGDPLDEEIRTAISEAATMAEAGFVPVLQAIAEKTTKDAYAKIAIDVFESLWRLKQSRDYFLAGAKGHQRNKWRAFFSILLLGRDPDNRETQRLFREIKAQTSDNQIQGGLAMAARVRFLATQYAALSTLEQKCAFVITHFRGDWNPLFLDASSWPQDTDPLAVWSQQQLTRFSKESPEQAARAVLAIDLSDDFEDPLYTRSYRAYLARFLGQKARRIFLKLERAGVKPGEGGK